MFAVMCDSDVIKDDGLFSHDRNLVAVFDNSTDAWDYIKHIPHDDYIDDHFDCKVKSDKTNVYDRVVEIIKTPVSAGTLGIHNEIVTYFVLPVIRNPESTSALFIGKMQEQHEKT